MGTFRTYLVSLFAAMTISAVVPAWALTPTQVAKLLADDGATADNFGLGMAIDGDTAVVGAQNDDDRGEASGSAYVFTRTGGVWTWTQQAKLLADDGDSGDRFGQSVAIDGDTVVIGAPARGAPAGGSAYVFTRSDGSWTQQAKLLPDNNGTVFGNSVAIDGDTIVIGDPRDQGDSSTAFSSGAAYVFTRSGESWTRQAKLSLPNDGDTVLLIGGAVDIVGDTIVIGATGDNAQGRFSGAAYVFTRSGESWAQQAKLLPDDGDAGDRFGTSIAINADTALISAVSDEEQGRSSGSAYVFTRSNGIWTQQAKLLPDDGDVEDFFGRSVAINDDTAVVGAGLDDDQGTNSGSAYVFRRSGRGWTQQAKLLPIDGLRKNDEFGGSRGLSGTGSIAIDGDIGVIGAPGGTLPGKAYVFSLTFRPQLFSPGDVNADGIVDLAVVTPEDEVIVKDLAGNPVNQFSFNNGPGQVVDAKLVNDINSNTAAEVVALGWAPELSLAAEVRDLLTGDTLSTVDFEPSDTSFDVEPVIDQTGNGIPELATLSRGRRGNAPEAARVQVEDGLGTQTVNTVSFSGYLRPNDLGIYPDLNSNGVPELGVLSENGNPDQNDPIEIRDLASGNVTQQIWLGKGWSVLQQALIADLNGNGAPEVAVLRVRAGAVNVLLRDTLSGAWLGSRGFNSDFPPLGLVVVPDINGNGTDELVVLGQRFDGANQRAVVKDSGTGAVLNRIWFDRNAVGQDVTTMDDINGNGADELVLLGHRASDDTLWAIVKDMATGERLARVRF